MTSPAATLEWFDPAPAVAVADSEYKRLLGFPDDHLLDGRAAELAAWARDWYAANGRPWIYLRGIDPLDIAGDTLRVEDIVFTSRRLREQLSEAHASQAAVAAVSAGPECEAHARQLWQSDRPDEYFFLEVFGSAVVEYLVTHTGARLCSWADAQGLAVLPHYSPGYTGWEIADQARLLALVRRGHHSPRSLETLETGMLRPKKSLLGLFGLTDRLDLARDVSRLIACESCSFAPCQFRRAPFLRSRACVEDVRRLQPSPPGADSPLALSRDASYSTNPRALRKWAAQRLDLTFQPDGGVDAVFHYEGTTCSNMGRALRYDYRVHLGPARDGYPILRAECAPAPGDTGYTFQCEYLNSAEAFAMAIATEKPLLNKSLNQILAWPRSYSPAGCYCELSSRLHKWGLVYEVIHFALVQRETQSKS